MQARPVELHSTQAARGSIAQEKSGALTNTNGFNTGLGPASSSATNWKPQQDSVHSQLPVYDLASQLKFSNHLQRLPPASSRGGNPGGTAAHYQPRNAIALMGTC